MHSKTLPIEIASEIVKVVAGNKGDRSASLLCRPEYIQSAAKLADGMSKVAVISGFYIVSAQAPETDGPNGAVILARAFYEAGREAEIWTDSSCFEIIRVCAKAAGFPEQFVKIHDKAIFTQEYMPDGIIFIERPGRAEDGRYYNFKQQDISKMIAPLDGYANLARTLNIPTIGIGDGGNEAGMGCFREALSVRLHDYSKCLSVISADVSIPVDVSNWGAYALTAALSCIWEEWRGHRDMDEANMLQALSEHGAVDGITFMSTASVDGFGMEVHEKVIAELYKIWERYCVLPL